MSERNIIINSSPNSKHERACTAGYMGLDVTAISQSRIMAQPDIDGALVGGAGLKADSFARIVQFKAL